MTIDTIKELYRSASREEILLAYKEVGLEETDKFSRDDSPLHLACTMMDSQAVELLLERGIEANTRNKYGQTALFALARLNEISQSCPEEQVRRCAKLLFAAGANVIRKDDDLGETPVTMAAQNGRFEILEEAAAHGVKLTISNKNGDNALHVTCWYVSSAVSSLGHACDEEEVREAKIRVENYYKSVKALLDGGLDPEEKNNSKCSALDIAIKSKAEDIVRLMAGAEKGKPCMTLARAVVEHNLDEARLNAEQGADLNAAVEEGDFKGMTPLTAACYTFDLSMVQLLLELGADPNYRDAKGRLPITPWFGYLGDFHLNSTLAMNKIPMLIVKALLDAGLDKDGFASDRSDSLLFAACNNADQGTGYNNTRLSRDIAKMLVAAKCNPNSANLDGITPLMTLCSKDESGIPALAADLLDAGASLDAVDKHGNTALHYAAKNRSANMGRELAELLFDYGFDAAAVVNNDGKTALELATEANNEPLVKLILMNT